MSKADFVLGRGVSSYELKKAAIDKLYASTGKRLPSNAVMVVICRAIGRRPEGGLTPSQIIRDYLGIKREVPQNAVAAPYRPPFRQMTPKPHPRLADIERSQPPFMTPRGAIGNGSEHSKVWRR